MSKNLQAVLLLLWLSCPLAGLASVSQCEDALNASQALLKRMTILRGELDGARDDEQALHGRLNKLLERVVQTADRSEYPRDLLEMLHGVALELDASRMEAARLVREFYAALSALRALEQLTGSLCAAHEPAATAPANAQPAQPAQQDGVGLAQLALPAATAGAAAPAVDPRAAAVAPDCPQIAPFINTELSQAAAGQFIQTAKTCEQHDPLRMYYRLCECVIQDGRGCPSPRSSYGCFDGYVAWTLARAVDEYFAARASACSSQGKDSIDCKPAQILILSYPPGTGYSNLPKPPG